MNADQPTVYVHLERSLDPADNRRRFFLGESNDEYPYGFHLAHQMGWPVEFAESAHGSARALEFARRLKRLLGFDILHAWHNRAAIRSCDVVWTITEGEAFAVAALMALRLAPRRPIIGNAI